MSTPASSAMRAWRAQRLGEPGEVLHLEEVPRPTPGPGQVRVAVSACGLNFADALVCRGTYQQRVDPPFTPGLEVVGVVEALGPQVGPRLGERVLTATVLPHGGFADACLARAEDLLALPDEVDDHTAVALYVTYQTAWVGLHRRTRLAAGEVLVVHAGAGATGSAAIQLGRAAGATVLATAGGADKVARCLALGAHEAVDSRSTDVAAWVRDRTGGRGADVVFDPVGGPLFEASRRCVAFEGRLVVVGFASGEVPQVPANHVLVKNYDVIGLQWPAYRDRAPHVVEEAHHDLLRLLAAGAIEPLVAAARPLEDAVAALEDLLARRTEGKVVLRP